jgi:hypothetical protein
MLFIFDTPIYAIAGFDRGRLSLAPTPFSTLHAAFLVAAIISLFAIFSATPRCRRLRRRRRRFFFVLRSMITLSMPRFSGCWQLPLLAFAGSRFSLRFTIIYALRLIFAMPHIDFHYFSHALSCHFRLSRFTLPIRHAATPASFRHAATMPCARREARF